MDMSSNKFLLGRIKDLEEENDRLKNFLELGEDTIYYEGDILGNFNPIFHLNFLYNKSFNVGQNRLEDFLNLTDESKLLREQSLLVCFRGETPNPYLVETIENGFQDQIYRVVEEPIIEGNSVVKIRGLARNITRYVKRHREIKQSHKILIDNAPVAIIESKDGIITFVNSKCSEISGYSLEELKGSDFVNFIHEDDRKNILRNYRLRQRGESQKERHYFRLITKEEDIKWVSVSSTNLFNSNLNENPSVLTFLNDETELLESFGELERIAKERSNTIEDFFRLLPMLSEQKDEYTAGHQLRVAELTNIWLKNTELSSKYNFLLEDNFKENVYRGAMIHDFGKFGVPFEILGRTGRLTPNQMVLMKEHPQIGYSLLKDIQHLPDVVKNVVLYHHERIDGSGYPEGLIGENIPFEARLVGAIDVFEAMATPRPYRRQISIENVIDELKSGRSILYDREIVDSFLEVYSKNENEMNKIMGL